MKRLEVLFERLSSAGLILYLAGIFGLILSIVAVIVKVTTLSEILIYGAYFFGFGFALMMPAIVVIEVHAHKDEPEKEDTQAAEQNEANDKAEDTPAEDAKEEPAQSDAEKEPDAE